MPISNVLATKKMDWSALTTGFTIPVEMQEPLYAAIGKPLGHGEKVDINILIDDEVFEASLQNSGFSRKKFASHKTDTLRIMYRGSSKLKLKLQSLFPELFNYLCEQKPLHKPKAQIKIPQEIEASIAILPTTNNLCFEITPIERSDSIPNIVSEETFESSDVKWIDKCASIQEKNRIIKIRRIDRSICDNLKMLYDYRCQITGEKIGDPYGTSVVEAHHIDYFINSQNNDSSNIIILSPNLHRIIHKTNPKFNHKKLQFEFANGVVERLRLNRHL